MPPLPKRQTHDHDVIKNMKDLGFEEVDAGGNGDCGFRVIGMVTSYFKNPDVVMTNEQARLEGAKLRGMAVSHSRKKLRSTFPFLPKTRTFHPMILRWTVKPDLKLG